MESKSYIITTYHFGRNDSAALLHSYFYDSIVSEYNMREVNIKEENLSKLSDDLSKLGYEQIKGSFFKNFGRFKHEQLIIDSLFFKNDKYKITIRIFDTSVKITYNDKETITYIEKELIPFFKKYHTEIIDKPLLKMLINTPHGLQIQQFDIRDVQLDLDNYNEDFVNANNKISDFIADENRSGLILLHGAPGTGKTSYIRSLISAYKQSSFIYIPNDMIETIVSPDFLPIISNNPKSVLILEDCERLIKSRDGDNATMGVSNILNMTDGLLSDCLKMKIIATFNCDNEKIDNALRRPGRLVYEYEFGYLTHDRVKKLLKKYNIDKEINKDKQYSLADIYSDTQTGFILPKKKQFGFEISEERAPLAGDKYFGD